MAGLVAQLHRFLKQSIDIPKTQTTFISHPYDTTANTENS